MLAGATKPNKAAIKALTVPYRFRYSPNLPDGAAWCTRELPEFLKAEELADMLRIGRVLCAVHVLGLSTEGVSAAGGLRAKTATSFTFIAARRTHEQTG